MPTPWPLADSFRKHHAFDRAPRIGIEHQPTPFLADREDHMDPRIE